MNKARKLKTLRAQYDDYIARVKARGAPVLTLETPCCANTIEVPAPRSKYQTWDSLCTCQWCGALFFKVVTSTEARAYIPEESEA